MSNQTEEEHNTMKPTVKRKWVAALRSGKYQRGKGQLKTHGRYCCLAVLGEITGIEYSAEEYFLDENKASEVTGLTKDQQEILANLNDGATHAMMPDEIPKACVKDKGMSFKALADWIEETL